MAYGKIKADTFVYDNSGSDVEVTLASLGNKANLASPTFTGTPAAPTAAANTNTTQIATTAYVQTELGDYLTTALGAPKASPALTGTATAVNLTLSGNLTVNGTTTTIDSTTLNVEDKNIELGKVDTPTDTTADGGGITLKGATDKTITWLDSTDSWTFNQSVTITGGQIKLEGIEGGASQILMYADEGDDNADKWKLASNTNGTFSLANYSSGGWSTGYSIDGSNNSTFYGSISDTKGDVRSIPSVAKSSQHALIASDAGKCLLSSSGGLVVNNSVMSAGDAVTFINNSSSDMTITINGTGSGLSLYNGATGVSGNKTLSAKGMATIWFAGADTGFISGAGLSDA